MQVKPHKFAKAELSYEGGAMSEIDQANGASSGLASDDSSIRDDARTPQRFQPGFTWGLVLGALLVVLVVAVGAAAVQIVTSNRRSRPPQQAPRKVPTVVVSPAKAGKQWFSVAPDGTGTLQGWESGNSGMGGQPAPGVVGYFDVGTADVNDGVQVVHTVHIYFTRKTEIRIGGQLYKKGKAPSPAEAVFGYGETLPGDPELLSERLLTIRFRRVGKVLVADSISAPLESTGSPLRQ